MIPLTTAAPASETQRPDPSATPLLETPKVTHDDGTKARRTAGPRFPARSTPDSAASDNRAAESATSDGASTLPSRVAGSLNLYQKLAAISKEVALKATGKTAQGAVAMSIADVEKALGDLLAAHGVVTDYSWHNETKIAATQGNNNLWLADITIRLTDADHPEDFLVGRSIDVGSSPSAAVSFCLKRYYRALFHLADEEDETRVVGSSRPKIDAAATEHLDPAELAELDRLNKLCPAPVPEGLAWNSMLKGRDFPTLKGMLEKRYATQTKDEA